MFIENAISILQSQWQKITKTRRRLLEKLAALNWPLNPYELREYNPQDSIDITTMYRNLELFEKLGLVHKITSVGWYMPCIHNNDHCCNKSHDIIICQSCHSIHEAHIDPQIKQSFWLSDWPVELSGSCFSCQKKRGSDPHSLYR